MKERRKEGRTEGRKGRRGKKKEGKKKEGRVREAGV